MSWVLELLVVLAVVSVARSVAGWWSRTELWLMLVDGRAGVAARVAHRFLPLTVVLIVAAVTSFQIGFDAIGGLCMSLAIGGGFVAFCTLGILLPHLRDAGSLLADPT